MNVHIELISSRRYRRGCDTCSVQSGRHQELTTLKGGRIRRPKVHGAHTNGSFPPEKAG